MTNSIDTINNIIESLEHKAEWREDVAERFPDDERNTDAAKDLRSLAGQVCALQRSRAEICQQIEDLENSLADTDSSDLYSFWSDFDQKLTDVGFRNSFSSGAALLEEYLEGLENARQQQIEEQLDEMDKAIAAPSLDAQVENDPAVKAAKAAYEEAKAKAYAEARKRI